MIKDKYKYERRKLKTKKRIKKIFLLPFLSVSSSIKYTHGHLKSFKS